MQIPAPQMRTSCVCRHCRCPNYAQEGEPRGLCLVCERVELWGKNSPAYRGCRCTCRCKLQVDSCSPSSCSSPASHGHDHSGGYGSPLSPANLLCADCAEQHRSNPRRHRPHGLPVPRGSAVAVAGAGAQNQKGRGHVRAHTITAIGAGVGVGGGLITPKTRERKKAFIPYTNPRPRCLMMRK